ncbi:FLYWCH zinc finger domain-containing protein [Phthorimaea operculella]|nr:FLYWCH zinc finger domain-containing protein [Phthorimaea operculella]
MITSKRGRPLLQIGAYTFYNKDAIGVKTRWVCSTHHCKACRAQVYMIDDQIWKLEYVSSKRGGVVMKLNGYCYHVDLRNDPRIRWRCSRRRGCRASVTTINGEIVKIANEHNH